jgi:hypothetical protein
MTTSQKSNGQQLLQQNNVSYKSKIITHNYVTIKDIENKSIVKTQTIGTTKADYLKYEKIDSNNINSSNKGIINIWAVNKNNPAILNDTLVSSPIIFGYLPSYKRSNLVNQMKQQNVFGIDFNNVNKAAYLNGKKVYIYDININLEKYVIVYSEYLNTIGQKDLARKMSNTISSGTYSAKLYVDLLSRQPLKIQPKNSDMGLEYSNFDLNESVQEPHNVKTTFEQLQLKINRL